MALVDLKGVDLSFFKHDKFYAFALTLTASIGVILFGLNKLMEINTVMIWLCIFLAAFGAVDVKKNKDAVAAAQSLVKEINKEKNEKA